MDDDEMSPRELAECVRINIANLARAVPAIAMHPFLLIAQMQARELADRLAAEGRT